jgi:hypothetical protein
MNFNPVSANQVRVGDVIFSVEHIKINSKVTASLK